MGRSVAYQLDKKVAKEAEFKLTNNPFEPDTRKWRMFNSFRRHSEHRNHIFDDIYDVYGFTGQKRVKINNTVEASNDKG